MIGLMLMGSLAVAAERGPCGTLPHLEELMALPRIPEGYVPPPPGPEKSLRDAYNVPNSEESTNFVVRWGDDGKMTAELAAVMLNIFEAAWEREIEEMGHPEPTTADAYKMNIYVGNSGDGAPAISGALGFFTTDSKGYPMMVMAPSMMDDWDTGKLTAAHEFYHSVQWGTGSYSYSGDAAWYWEATASWIEVEVYPDDPGYADNLYGFAYLPHLALNFFDYPDSGKLQELHQYGAFIFPRYLAEFEGGWEMVRDSWVDASRTDPLETLRDLLDDEGRDLDEVVADFAARNAFWDYEHESAYEDAMDAYEDYYASQDFRVAYEVARSGTTGVVEVPEELLPERYGYNIVMLNKPYDGRLALRFDGDPESSGGRDTDWQVRVVVVAEGSRDYQVVEVVDGVAEHDIGDVSEASSVALVVVPVTSRYVEDEVHGYSFELYFTEGGDSESGSSGGGLAQFDSGEEGKGCGCSVPASRPVGSWSFGLLAMAASLVVRRRRAGEPGEPPSPS